MIHPWMSLQNCQAPLRSSQRRPEPSGWRPPELAHFRGMSPAWPLLAYLAHACKSAYIATLKYLEFGFSHLVVGAISKLLLLFGLSLLGKGLILVLLNFHCCTLCPCTLGSFCGSLDLLRRFRTWNGDLCTWLTWDLDSFSSHLTLGTRGASTWSHRRFSLLSRLCTFLEECTCWGRPLERTLSTATA